MAKEVPTTSPSGGAKRPSAGKAKQRTKESRVTKSVTSKKSAASKSSARHEKLATRKKAAAKPAGGPAVREALIHAAEQLFLERSPADVTLREVAAYAGVNYSLVYRYFGTKEALLASVFEAAIPRNREIFANALDIRSAMREAHRAHYQTGYARALAWAILEGMDLNVLHANPELVDELLARMEPSSGESVGESDIELRVLIASVMVLLMGWDLYEPYLLRITGMESVDKPTLNKHLIGITDRLLSFGSNGEMTLP
jgi:AcrR family transcriptional regulator